MTCKSGKSVNEGVSHLRSVACTSSSAYHHPYATIIRRLHAILLNHLRAIYASSVLHHLRAATHVPSMLHHLCIIVYASSPAHYLRFITNAPPCFVVHLPLCFIAHASSEASLMVTEIFELLITHIGHLCFKA